MTGIQTANQTTAPLNTQIRLARMPNGLPVAEDFVVEQSAIPVPQQGQFLIKTRFLSLDPYMRSVIAGRHLSGALQIGDLLPGEVVGEVIASRNEAFQHGDLLALHAGWQAYALSDGVKVRRIDSAITPLSLALGILGMPGLTAYAGLLHLAEPKAGDTVVVSAASGAVGSMVGQIAKLQGCRVIGIAGAVEKCDWVVKEAGFDACINYKQGPLAASLKAACPDGIDIYFDNVGGATLQAVMEQLALNARVVLCGLMDQYNGNTVPAGPNPGLIIRSRATVRGLVVYDHFHRWDAFLHDAGGWLAAGRLHFKEDVTRGLENAPAAFARLMAGQNFGKAIVQVSP